MRDDLGQPIDVLGGVQAVTPLVPRHGLIVFDSRKEVEMDGEETGPQQGLYTVRVRQGHDGDETPDLSFPNALRLLEDRFEKSKGAVHYVSISRQE